MIRCGELCRDCTNTCKDLPEFPTQFEAPCPACNGHGCDECDQGHFFIEGCPQEACADVARAIGYIDLFYKGIPPINGGALDQSGWFLSAARYFANEEARIKADAYGNS